MPKPSTLPRWANSGGSIVEPLSGKKDIGWVGGTEKPPAQYFNWLHKITYDWLKWIDDGAWTAVSLAASGAISGASATISGAISGASAAITGAITGASATLTGALSAASAAITGNATVGGTLGVTGDATFQDDIRVEDSISCGGPIVPDSGEHILLSGTGRYKHTGTIYRQVSIARGIVSGGSPTFQQSDATWIAGAGSEEVEVPLEFLVGEEITEIKCRVNPNGAGTIVCRLYRKSLTGGGITMIAFDSSDGTANSQWINLNTLAISPFGSLAELVSGDYTYHVQFTSAQSGDRFEGVSAGASFP